MRNKKGAAESFPGYCRGLHDRNRRYKGAKGNGSERGLEMGRRRFPNSIAGAHRMGTLVWREDEMTGIAWDMRQRRWRDRQAMSGQAALNGIGQYSRSAGRLPECVFDGTDVRGSQGKRWPDQATFHGRQDGREGKTQSGREEPAQRAKCVWCVDSRY